MHGGLLYIFECTTDLWCIDYEVHQRSVVHHTPRAMLISFGIKTKARTRCKKRRRINMDLLFNLYISSGRWYLSHVPSTFASVNTHANVFFVFLAGGISKEWRHIVLANCHFEGNLPGQYRVFTGLSGNTWGDHK